MGCAHIEDSGRNKVNQLHSVISNRDVNLNACGSEVWEGFKTQAATLESIMLGGAKRILGCSSKTCNEAVRGIWAWIPCRVVGIKLSCGIS